LKIRILQYKVWTHLSFVYVFTKKDTIILYILLQWFFFTNSPINIKIWKFRLIHSIVFKYFSFTSQVNQTGFVSLCWKPIMSFKVTDLARMHDSSIFSRMVSIFEKFEFFDSLACFRRKRLANKNILWF
jgi:hypothetical protein